MIVVDASILVDLIAGRPLERVLRRRLSGVSESLHAPHMVDAEVLQALRRLVAAGSISSQRADDALQEYFDIRITRYPHRALLPRVWQLRQNFTAYDAMYVALAEVLNAPLLTLDGGLAKASALTNIRVELFA